MKVIYDERMVADARSFSPSARKPRAVMTSWRRRFPVLEVAEPGARHDRPTVPGA